LKPRQTHLARSGVKHYAARISLLHPGGQRFQLCFVGFRDVFSLYAALKADTARTFQRRRSVRTKEPRPVLDRHIAGVGGVGGIQLGIKLHGRDASCIAQRVDAVQHPELDIIGIVGADAVNLRQGQAIRADPTLGRTTTGRKAKGHHPKDHLTS